MVEWVDTLEGVRRPAVVCLGFFDGVHRGHVELIRAAKAVSSLNGWLVCAHTYDRSPFALVFPGSAVPELTDLGEKCGLLEAAGVDFVAVSRFDKDLMTLSGTEFFKRILVDRLNAKHLVAGFNHRFGYRGDTDTGRLRPLCEASGVGLTVVPPVVNARGDAISSTAIRAAILRGEIALAEEMLGRPCTKQMLLRVRQAPGPQFEPRAGMEDY